MVKHNEVLFKHKKWCLIRSTKWMDLKDITLNEINQKQKETSHSPLLYPHPQMCVIVLFCDLFFRSLRRVTSRGPDGRERRDSWRLDSRYPHSDKSKEQQEDYDSQKPRIYFINF